MHKARETFFTGAGFAFDQNSRSRFRNTRGLRQQRSRCRLAVSHIGGGADQLGDQGMAKSHILKTKANPRRVTVLGRDQVRNGRGGTGFDDDIACFCRRCIMRRIECGGANARDDPGTCQSRHKRWPVSLGMFTDRNNSHLIPTSANKQS